MMLHQKLEQIFEGILNHPVALTDDTVIAGLQGWDSVAQVNLMFTLEQEFGIEFSTREISEAQTVGDLKQVLRRGTMARGSAGAMRY